MNNYTLYFSGRQDVKVERSNVIDIHRCSACSKDHYGLIYDVLKKEVDINSIVFTHFTFCPETQETVYIRFEE